MLKIIRNYSDHIDTLKMNSTNLELARRGNDFHKNYSSQLSIRVRVFETEINLGQTFSQP